MWVRVRALLVNFVMSVHSIVSVGKSVALRVTTLITAAKETMHSTE